MCAVQCLCTCVFSAAPLYLCWWVWVRACVSVQDSDPARLCSIASVRVQHRGNVSAQCSAGVRVGVLVWNRACVCAYAEEPLYVCAVQ